VKPLWSHAYYYPTNIIILSISTLCLDPASHTLKHPRSIYQLKFRLLELGSHYKVIIFVNIILDNYSALT
jgi:hypothetical protein